MLLGSSVCIESTGVMVRTGAQGSQSGLDIFLLLQYLTQAAPRCCGVVGGSTEMLLGSR